MPVLNSLLVLKNSTIGKAKPRVFPDPVRSLTIRSSRSYTFLNVIYYTGNKLNMPRLLSPSMVFLWIYGKFEKSPGFGSVWIISEFLRPGWKLINSVFTYFWSELLRSVCHSLFLELLLFLWSEFLFVYEILMMMSLFSLFYFFCLLVIVIWSVFPFFLVCFI